MRARRKSAREKALRQFATAAAGEEDERQLARLVASVVRRFGGIEALAAAWVAQIRRAQESAPGSARLLRSFVAFGKLLTAAEQQQNDTDSLDLRSATDRELDEMRVQGLLELVAQHPELALKAAEVLGWRVIPPECPN
jgi:hypothetical protein